MDYQRACGITGRALPQRPRMYQPWQMGGNRSEAVVPCAPEAVHSEKDCGEHLAIVTSPVQCWQNLYSPCEALMAGTLFKDLNLPLVGCMGNTNCPWKMGGLK